MALILSGTDGLSDVDGSAATPAIRGTDANTGIFFPAADQVAITTGGTQRVVVDASGNVGIGTSSPDNKLEIALADNQGINLEQTGSGQTGYINWRDSDGTLSGRISYDHGTDALRFNTLATERMRIDSSGNLLVGTTTAHGKLGCESSANSRNIFAFSTIASGFTDAIYVSEFRSYSPNNTSARFMYCGDTVGERMAIRSNGGIANFSGNNVNLSDRREKTNFAPAGEYLAKICAIPVQTFNYIDQNLEEDDGLTLGVVAQDVQTVAPELVMESDWSAEKDGSKMRLSIYQTDLQYALMKSIQELKALVDTQASTITQLQADVEALKAQP